MVNLSTATLILPSGSAKASTDNADPTASSGVPNGSDSGANAAFSEASPFSTVFTQAVIQQNAPSNAVLSRPSTPLTTPATRQITLTPGQITLTPGQATPTPGQATPADASDPLPTDTPAEIASTTQPDGEIPANATAGDAAPSSKSKTDTPKTNAPPTDALPSITTTSLMSETTAQTLLAATFVAPASLPSPNTDASVVPASLPSPNTDASVVPASLPSPNTDAVAVPSLLLGAQTASPLQPATAPVAQLTTPPVVTETADSAPSTASPSLPLTSPGTPMDPHADIPSPASGVGFASTASQTAASPAANSQQTPATTPASNTPTALAPDSNARTLASPVTTLLPAPAAQGIASPPSSDSAGSALPVPTKTSDAPEEHDPLPVEAEVIVPGQATNFRADLSWHDDAALTQNLTARLQITGEPTQAVPALASEPKATTPTVGQAIANAVPITTPAPHAVAEAVLSQTPTASANAEATEDTAQTSFSNSVPPTLPESLADTTLPLNPTLLPVTASVLNAPPTAPKETDSASLAPFPAASLATGPTTTLTAVAASPANSAHTDLNNSANDSHSNTSNSQQPDSTNLGAVAATPAAQTTAANATVASPSANAPSTADRAQIVAQVTNHLETMRLVNGRGEISLRLQPDSLGSLHLTLSSRPDGIVARFVTETTQVQHAMEGAKDQLRAALENRGMRLNSLEVSVGQGSTSDGRSTFASSQQGTSQERAWARPTQTLPAEPVEEAATVPETSRPSLTGSASRLDYRA